MTSMHRSGAAATWKVVPRSTPSTPLLNKLTEHVSRAKTPHEILDGLDDFATRLLPPN